MELKYLERDGIIVNKSHAASYAYIAFQTAYLKCHYPVEFFSALLTVFGDKDVKLSNYIQDAKANGLSILPPDINYSDREYKIIDDKTIRYGFGTIKGLPEKAVTTIIEKRPFSDLGDLINRTLKSELNKKAVQILSLSGTLDSISGGIENRQEILNRLFIYRGNSSDASDKDLFTRKKMLEEEKRLLGVYMSGHPLDGIAKPIDWDVAEEELGRVVGHCTLSNIRRISTKKGDPMAFLSLSFMEKNIDAVCFPMLYEKPFAYHKGDPLIPIGQALQEDMVLKISGQFQENHRGEIGFVLHKIEIPVRANEEVADKIQSLQDTIGVEQKVREPVSAPVFSLDELL